MNLQNEVGYTPLHCAIYFHLKDTVKLLIRSGANAHIKDFTNESPWDLAIRFGQCEVFKLLSWNWGKRFQDHEKLQSKSKKRRI